MIDERLIQEPDEDSVDIIVASLPVVVGGVIPWAIGVVVIVLACVRGLWP